MSQSKKFRSAPLSRELVALAEHVGLTAIDVGARGQINADLKPIASAVSWFCLEPDIEAPKDASSDVWRRVEYLPVAAAAREETVTINLYKQRGCSSKLVADQLQAARFSRAHYYEYDGLITLDAQPLDDIIPSDYTKPATFMKIDVQGMELECFAGARRLLGQELLAVRTEVSFLPLYKGQPLFSEVELALRNYGFQPMQWLERHDWRRSSLAKLPKLANGDLPYSLGQMVHGDVIFMRAPEDMPSANDQEIQQLIRLALVAACYGQFDHAYAALRNDCVLAFCQDTIKVDPLAAIKKSSQASASAFRMALFFERLFEFAGR